MSEITNYLRDADPIAREGGLPPDEAARLRAAVVVAAAAARPPAVNWTRTIAIAATIALFAGAGALTVQRASPVLRDVQADAPLPPTAPAKTQVHFSTPGGTRIIWTLDPAFHLTENR